MPRAKKKQVAPFVINYATYGITLTEHKNKLDRHYDGNLKQFRDDLQANPYHVFVDICDMSFTYADTIIIRCHHANPDAYCRCQYAAYAALQKNELEGNTRMTDAELARGVNEVAHEAMSHIVDVVKNDPLIHYEPSRHLVAFEQTYQDELLIADHLKARLARHEPIEHDIEQYRHDGDMELTDEQMAALRMVLDNDVCMINGSAGCVDANTEFFTGRGWKRIADYEDGDMVLQYNEDGTAELVEPMAYIKQPCDYLWHFETPHSINQTVCEQHRIIYKWPNFNSIKETNVLALKEKSDNNINWNGRFITQFYHFGDGLNLTDEQIRVMIAVMADGRYSTWRNPTSKSTHCHIRLKKKRKIYRLHHLLSEANISYDCKVDKCGVTIFSFYAPERRKVYGDEWWNVNEHQAKIICDEVVHWDGCIEKSRVHEKEKPVFRTTEKASADYIQYIFNINGWQSTIVTDENTPSRREYAKTVYKVSTKHNTTTGLCFDTRPSKTKTKFERVVTTDGFKYCFTVPSHMLVLRRKDCVFVTGNCGKSQTTKAVVNMLDDMGLTYQLLAPTGIASKVLRNYTGRSAMTCHMFLLNSWKPDYIILDEASICSVHLLAVLLSQIGYEPKLIFIADNAQLASIQCGSLVQNMIDSGLIPRVELTKIFRYNSSGIVTMATDIRHGSCDHLTADFPDYLFVPEDENDPIGQVVEQYDRLIADGYSIDDIVVLCPFNKRVGADAINAAISAKYNRNEPVRKNSAIKLGDKVLNCKNNYHGGGKDDMIANGDVGYLRFIGYDYKTKTNTVAVEFADGIKNVASLSVLKQAYAMSTHKSQGSSAKAVIVLIDPMHGFMLSRNLLYTAVTRARERLVIVGDADTIMRGIRVEENMRRNTWLKEMLDNHTTI